MVVVGISLRFHIVWLLALLSIMTFFVLLTIIETAKTYKEWRRSWWRSGFQSQGKQTTAFPFWVVWKHLHGPISNRTPPVHPPGEHNKQTFMWVEHNCIPYIKHKCDSISLVLMTALYDYNSCSLQIYIIYNRHINTKVKTAQFLEWTSPHGRDII